MLAEDLDTLDPEQLRQALRAASAEARHDPFHLFEKLSLAGLLRRQVQAQAGLIHALDFRSYGNPATTRDSQVLQTFL